ncbi:MAG: hypothetical protein IH825_05255 [Candidatus Marinimicrobia bacterium]|nr:hypothetical protein [Candidatus Neomarinimicrobiota bacterium]
MKLIGLKLAFMPLILYSVIINSGCAGQSEEIYLRPGKQIAKADVNLDSGSITQTIENVELSVKGAIIASRDGESLHPTFWVTVKNNRAGKITLNPSKARLVDSFGFQFRPLPMSFSGGTSQESYYTVVDPDIRMYFALRHGWHYYPFYPQRSRFRGGGSFRIRPIHYDPHWGFSSRVVWVKNIRKKNSLNILPDRMEEIYTGAKITYVLTYPELNKEVQDYRLIIPGINVVDEDGSAREIIFEIGFDQITEIDSGTDSN